MVDWRGQRNWLRNKDRRKGWSCKGASGTRKNMQWGAGRPGCKPPCVLLLIFPVSASMSSSVKWGSSRPPIRVFCKTEYKDEYDGGLRNHIPDPEIEPASPASKADSLPTEPPRKPQWRGYIKPFQAFTGVVVAQRSSDSSVVSQGAGAVDGPWPSPKDKRRLSVGPLEGPERENDLGLSWCKCIKGLPWWLSGKESACQCKRHKFDSWIGKIPWRRKWQPIPVFLPGKSHGQRCLEGYSPWGRKRVRHDLATKQQPTTRMKLFHKRCLANP